jgi:ATPase subunit of ABC transporter with duplicated ATPase domains
MPTHSVVCDDLSFHWPDGTPVIDHLDAAFDTGRTGLVGLNGSGKSSLLRLIAGELLPSRGSVTTAGDVGYLPQQLPLTVERTVADLLGIGRELAALRAITGGDTSEAAFTALDDNWDVEERALAELARFGLPCDRTTLDRTVGTLSGGEAVLVGVAGLLLRRAAITLLDEPTNNLDRDSRHRLYGAVETWPGVLLVVSHDRALLDRVERIADLRDGAIRNFGGSFTAYEQQLAAELETAERAVRAAEGVVNQERRQLIDAQTKLARRQRFGRTAALEKRVPGVVANARKRAAQESAGKYRIVQQQRLAAARAALGEAEDAVRDDDRVRIELPGTVIPAGRSILEVAGLGIRGPERIALLGGNGSGKTTKLCSIVADPAGFGVTVPIGYLPQRLDVLDPAASVLDNVRAAAPHASPNQIRAGLARFLIRGDQIERPAATLSGGERFRVSLARLLLATPPPQLFLLDEPTNNLDLASVEQLGQALSAYRGALVVASHDERFLDDIAITRWWVLDQGRLAETGPPR